jgi:hypothetical protein
MAKTALSPDTNPLAKFTKLRRHSVCEGGITAGHLIDVEHFDLDKAEPEDMARQCANADDMWKSMVVRKAIPDAVYIQIKEAAIYVIGTADRKMSKVGVAVNPAMRIKALQCGCPVDLKIHALFWIVEGEPVTYEKTIHKVAAEMGYNVKREWIETSPSEAALLVATLLHKLDAKVADSAMWVRQREMIRMYLRADEIADGTHW